MHSCTSCSVISSSSLQRKTTVIGNHQKVLRQSSSSGQAFIMKWLGIQQVVVVFITGVKPEDEQALVRESRCH